MTKLNAGSKKIIISAKAFEFLFFEIIWTFCFSFFFSLALIPAVLLGKSILHYSLILMVLYIPIGFYLFLFCFIIIGGIIVHLLPGIKIGRTEKKRTGSVFIWMCYAAVVNFYRIPSFTPLIYSNPILRLLYFKAFKAKIHHSVIISYQALILDPCFFEIGKGSKIGEWAKLVGHFSNDRGFYFNKTLIGKNVTIGGDSIIFPGVIIGDNVEISIRSVVLPGSIIPECEVWGGNPARFIRKIKSMDSE